MSFLAEKKIVIAVLMTLAIFLLDLITPAWYEAWILYVIPLFLMFQSERRPYAYSAFVTVLIVAGLFLSPSDGIPFMHALTNRLTGILGGWGISLLLNELGRVHSSLLRSRSELEKRVQERTAELLQVNKALQEDVAERRKVVEALRESEERYRLLFHKTPIGIFNYDAQLVLTECNDRFVQILRSSREKLSGLDMKKLKDQSIFPAISKAIEGDEGHYEGFYQATTGPAEVWVSMRTAPIFDSDRKVCSGVGIVEDITKRKRMEEELRALSLHDDLTGLYNRRGFFILCNKQLQVAKRQLRGIFMLYADLDGLKRINDTLGHKEGDRSLSAAADILRTTYRESDIIARISGDEFVVTPIGATMADVEIAAARLQKNIDIHNAKRESSCLLSMSWGVSFFDPKDPCSVDDLLSRADQQMYEHKKLRQRS